ncbi:MAG: transporter substrate-binding domain-containing protein [Myxococcota bacterium]
MSCPHCGSQIPRGALRCPGCGASAPGSTSSAGRAGGGRSAAVVGAALGLGGLGVLVALVAGPAVWFALRSPPPVSGPGPAPVAVTSPAATVRGDGFDAVRAAGRFTVAADPNAPPFLSGGPGAWEGFEYALIAAVADAAKVEVAIVPTPYDDLRSAVSSGAVDVAIGQLPPTDAPGIAYSRSYLQYALCLTVRADQRVRGLADLRAPTIGLYDDPTARGVVDAALGSAWTPKLYGDYGYFADLAGGRLDAVVYDCPLTRYELRGQPGLQVVDDHLGVATYSIAVASGRPVLRADIDRVLAELGANGLLQQLAERLLGQWSAPDRVGVVVVRPGEGLAEVAARSLGDAAFADELVGMNRDILGTGADERATVYPGMQLRTR